MRKEDGEGKKKTYELGETIGKRKKEKDLLDERKEGSFLRLMEKEVASTSGKKKMEASGRGGRKKEAPSKGKGYSWRRGVRKEIAKEKKGGLVSLKEEGSSS